MRDALPLVWREIPERYNLIGSICENCKQEFFPQRLICPNCRRKGNLVEKKMPGEGKVFSFTEVHSGAKGFENETPYSLAIIELANGVKVLGHIVDAQPDKIRIGAKVSVVFRKIFAEGEEGIIAYGYKFKIAD
ncbi:MAG TPA: Zn-ribbon domain-containing OB-fold protein [Candidatus Norongarragalinales archaeon]|nr:Zn-ribbon domain-containing OB-fold protein [Candidatus Norongarragalinales archaeon]